MVEPRLDLRTQLLIAHQKSQNRQAQRIKPFPLREIIETVSLEVFVVRPGYSSNRPEPVTQQLLPGDAAEVLRRSIPMLKGVGKLFCNGLELRGIRR